MSQVIQSKCPKCQNVLRIPADWIGKSMRCKHCKEVFQAQARAAVPVAAAVAKPAVAVARPASARPAANGDPFAFDDTAETNTPVPRSRQRKKGGGWKLPLLAVCILAAGGAAFVLAVPYFKKGQDPKPDNDPVVKNDRKQPETPDPESEDPPTKKPGKPPEKKPFVKKIGKGNPKPIGQPFPRRALLISVCNYLYANPLNYGSPRDEGYPGSSTAALADKMTRRPMNVPATQVLELSDGARSPQPTLKPIIEAAIADFCDTCREQDRVVILFAGHAVDIDKDAYLVPLEGDMKDVSTLIPLKWVYDRMTKCLAWQKVLILDVCRFPPARGLELPGSGEMGEIMDAMVKNPPVGVQVWASCSKGEQAYEFERGSAFLQSLSHAMQEGLAGIQEPSNPLPLESLTTRVTQKMKELLTAEKLEQTPQLAGSAPKGTPPYDASEPLAAAMAFRKPAPPKGQFAGEAFVRNILDEINKIPPIRAARQGADNMLQVAYLPPFPAKALDPYKEKYGSFAELKQMIETNPKEYPLRVAVMNAAQALRDNAKFVMEESLTSPGGAVTPQIKKQFLAKQKEPGIAIFELDQALKKLQTAGKKRDEETSQRWQANYDYTLARMMSRLVYTYEYNFVLADVRADRLPNLNSNIHNGWRVGSRPKVQIKEEVVKDLVKSIDKTWKKIVKTYPDTPWAVMAKRESMTALGLEWRPSRD